MNLEPDAKLRWLLDNALLDDFHYRHEAFLALEKAFPLASEEMKQAVWATGWAEYERSTADDRPLPPNFAVWINRIAPEFEPAASAVATFAGKHPDWVPSEHPEFINYMGEVTEIPPARLPPEIDEAPTYDALRQLELTDRSSFGTSNLQDAVAAKIAKDPGLAITLMEGLAADRAWDSALWRAAHYGLERAHIGGDLWPSVFAAVVAHPDAPLGLDTLSSVLLDAIEAEQPAIHSASFEGAAQAILGLLGRLVAADLDFDDPRDDLMFEALNSWPGRVANYLVQTAVTREKEGADPCTASGLEGFVRAVNDSNGKNWGKIAMASLGRLFPYLLERCPVLANQYLLPTFDWTNPSPAKAAWQGAAYARWSRRTVEALYPFLADTADHLSEFEAQAQHGLCNTLAGIGLTIDEDPTEAGGWLSALVLGNDDSTRATFARFVESNLESLSEEGRAVVWNTWLRRWWTDRVAGFPAAIGPDEASIMLGWIFPLRAHLSEIVPLVTAVPVSGHDFGFLHKLGKSDLPSSAPTEVVRLVIHVLRAPLDWWHPSDSESILRAANDHGADPAVLREACDAVVGLGGQRPDFCPDV